MKKGVLLTGVLAAGLAAAPVTAKADVASAPQIHDSVKEDATVVSTKLLDLLQGLDYDLAAIKKQIYEKSDRFVGMEDEAQEEALNDIVNIATQIQKSREDFQDLKGKYDTHAVYTGDALNGKYKGTVLSEEAFVELVNDMVYNPVITREQAQQGLYERYTHLDQDWKKYRAFQKKGDELWSKVMKVVNSDDYRGVDEIADVHAAHEAVNEASKNFRKAYIEYHENRTKTWNGSDNCHVDDKQCLVEAENYLNEVLYAEYKKAYEALDNLVKNYYVQQGLLQAKIDNVDPKTYTKSVFGIDYVERLQKKAHDFIDTFNASNVQQWENYLTGEDSKGTPFEKISEYVDKAGQLIDELNAAVAEAKANEDAYQKGVAAYNDRMAELEALNNKYKDKALEGLDHEADDEVEEDWVYRHTIAKIKHICEIQKGELDDAYNNWVIVNADDPENAVEYVTSVTEGADIFAEIKRIINDHEVEFGENETFNKKNHELTNDVRDQYKKMTDDVKNYTHVNIENYTGPQTCDDGREFNGTDGINAGYNKFVQDEQFYYNNVRSKEYNKTALTINADLDENIELLWNHIATDQCKASLYDVIDAYWVEQCNKAEDLDPVCEEFEGDGVHCHCLPEDTAANPCGWCDPTASDEHDKFKAGFTAKVELLDETHKKVLDKNVEKVKDLVNDYILYEGTAKTAIDKWLEDFTAADKAHKDKLVAALHTSTDQAHSLEHIAEIAEHHLDSFTTGDRAAADAWVAAKGYEGVTNFAEYVNFLRENHDLMGKIKNAYDEHHYTELVNLGVYADELVKGADYTKDVDANKTANDALLAQLAAVAESVKGLETEWNAAADAVYENDKAALKELIAALEKVEVLSVAITEAYEGGVAVEKEEALGDRIAALANGVQNVRAEIVKALEFKYKNVETAAKFNEQIANLETLQESLDTTWAVYEDIESDKDAKALNAAYQAITELISAERLAIAADVAAGTVVANAETHEEKIGDINDAIKALQDNVRVFEKFYADNKAAKEEFEGLYAALIADVNAAVIGDVYEADKTILENSREQLLNRINVEVGNVVSDFEKGEVCKNYEDLKAGYAEFLKDVEGFVGQIKDAEKKLADNKAAAAAYIETVNDLAAVVRATIPGEVYEADLETLVDAQAELLGKLVAENGAIDAALKAGTVLTDKATIEEAIAVLSIAVQEYQGKVKTAEKFYADSKDKTAAVSTMFSGLLDELKTLSYGDVYADDAAEIEERIATLKTQLQNELKNVAVDFKNREVLDNDYTEPINYFTADVKGLNDFIKDCEKRLADNKAAKAELDSQLAAFQATVNGIVLNNETLYEDDYDTLFGKLEDLRDLIGTVSGEIAAAFEGKVATEYQFPSTLATKLVELQGEKVTLENLYAANVAARAEKLNELANLEVALNAVMLDAKQVYNTENHKDFEELETMAEAIQAKIDNARTSLAAAFDNKVAPEFIVDVTIAADIEQLKLAVSDFQEFKRQNIEKATLLYNDLTNLLAEIEGLKKYGPVYEDEVEGGYDKTHIDRQIETLINSLKGALNWLKNDLESGDVVANLDTYGQDYDFALEEIENIKAGIEAAEQLYAVNLRALNNLEEMIMAEKTVLENTKAMCACNECNTEDKAAVDALVGTLDTILGNVNDAFADTKDLWQLEGQFKGQVDDVKADAANLLALIQLHLDLVQNDLRVYNTLQSLLVNVDAELLKLEAEEGFEHFKFRGAHLDSAGTMCTGTESNPDVKYFDELTTSLNELKAEIDRQHSHEGGHSCEENKLADVKAMNELTAEIQKTVAAVKANEAAHKLIIDRFNELYAAALDAYNFWKEYYSEQTLSENSNMVDSKWVEIWNGELEGGWTLDQLQNLLHNSYVHGNAANAWTVDGKGEALNDAANDKFAGYDADLANDRNYLAHEEAKNHAAQVALAILDYQALTLDEYTNDGYDDPFVAEELNAWRGEVEGEYGLIASLNYYKEQIELAYEEKVMEDALNIDEHNSALGLHQQLEGVKATLGQIKAEYAELFAEAHHLTNGKSIYSDQEYFTLGFFKKANDGSVENGQEMFKEVKVLVNDDIRLYDSRSYVWNDMGTPDDWSDDEALLDEKGRVVYDKDNNPGEVAEVKVLTVGAKSNELSFNFHQNPMALERETLKAGTAEIDFLPGSISVKNDNLGKAWVTKHTVSIDGLDVLAPEVADMEVTPYASNGKLIVRAEAPIDLTYTINSLVAHTNNGAEISYADRELNYAAGQIEFILPEGTETVELPAGFFTFRTGENTIARSAACVVNVNKGTTSIDELVAMGEKAQIFDLQGRRVKAEGLISGNTYVVNGEKVMVK